MAENYLDTIPSVPFAVEFKKPVAKLICGDLFSGLLTSEGELFTWGWNVYGQLGLRDSSIGVTLTPLKVDFAPKDRIIDVACGFNHCIALTDSQQVYVWGKRMGIYPAFEFDLRGIEESQSMQMKEVN